jgi:hypothetical protein
MKVPAAATTRLSALLLRRVTGPVLPATVPPIEYSGNAGWRGSGGDAGGGLPPPPPPHAASKADIAMKQADRQARETNELDMRTSVDSKDGTTESESSRLAANPGVFRGAEGPLADGRVVHAPPVIECNR